LLIVLAAASLLGVFFLLFVFSYPNMSMNFWRGHCE